MTFPRNRQPELMDDPALPVAEHQHALSGLSRLNRIGGVATAMYRQIRRYAGASSDHPLRVLDIASGAGDLPVGWARLARKQAVPLQVTATDISSVAVEEQQRRAREAGIELQSLQLDCLSDDLPPGFDLVTCSLFMHHLDPPQVASLLQKMQAVAQRAVLVCDLERSRLNLLLVAIGSRLLTRSHVVHTDALLSVRAAFTRKEFHQIAEQSLGKSATMRVMFPCRFVMSVNRITTGKSAR